MSALIFVALAVAWAAYLIPKALRHHSEADESRSVENFSSRMRVVAHREPISRKATRLVTPSETRASDGTPTPEDLRARRLATRRATQRRRRVLSLILVALVVVGGLAVNGTIQSWYAAIPGGLLVVWLILCRVMVKSERRTGVSLVELVETPTANAKPDPADADTETIPRVGADATPSADPSLWDPVPVTLPTYVTKPAARRTVRAIDLESSGVWTSGRSEIDSAIAREAEEVEASMKKAEADEAARAELADENEAVGS